ncbi:MAG TPA: AIR synthase-related protein [Myxococcota bacterium]|nr:AIR synthase-related protein [Myxococcota bacterium]HRY93539.1 AIR synthase-related protein [Myxococcota bacterium]HSA21239.1 AIR synthase-related protein [Myxococcota bacterium]
MAQRIEIGLREGMQDAPGDKVRRRLRAELGLEVAAVRCVDVYTVDAELPAEALARVAVGALSDPVSERAAVGRPFADDGPPFDWALEVGLRPGVTDNVGRTAREALALVLDRPFQPGEGVYHARQYLISGALPREAVERLARDLLSNALIQRHRVLSAAEHRAQGGFAPEVPRVHGAGRAPLETLSLELADGELQALSRRRVLALNLAELGAIRDAYRDPSLRAARTGVGLGPEPTDVELECLAQTWSEHCKHKIFQARVHYREAGGPEELVDSIFKTYVRGLTERVRADKGPRDLCLSVFVDNAGVIRFSEDWSLVFKVETHNSPSALDPYGGALTGIVGVNRDPFGTGQGARLVFNTDVFCLADPFRATPVPPGLLHPRRVLEGVREGVEHGGNKSGIPTLNGSVVFDERFLGKPLVFCGTAGLLPARLRGAPGHEKAAQAGDRIVMVGGRIGKDGIHGATFSSEELHEGSPVSAVQIGDPITQKRMTDMLLVARDRGLYRCITDDGAGGLSSSVGEMAEGPGGCELDLTHAPLKYAGLAAWEILVSEAQERMTLAVPPERMEQLMELARRYQVEATDLGRFTSSGWFHVLDQGVSVAYLPMAFLHEGLPRLELRAEWAPPARDDRLPPAPADQAGLLRRLLGRLNVCSKEYWVRQYDHEVQAGSVLKPLCGLEGDGPADAAVFRPLLDDFRAVAISHGLCPRLSDLDAHAMAQAAVDEAVRNAVAVGADPDRLAGLDNFCWCDPVEGPGNPDGAFKLGQLVRAARGLYELCVAYGVPCISGKDSMKNDAVVEGRRISIPPTLLFSVLGLMDDARLAVSMDAKRAGHRVYVLGTTRPELGASEYFGAVGLLGGAAPRVRAAENLALYRAVHRAMRRGLVASCHDCSDGGLGVALAEVAFAGGLGLDLALSQVPASLDALDAVHVPASFRWRDDLLLYAESAGRFVATVAEEHAAAFEDELRGLASGQVGVVMAEPRLRVRGLAGGVILDEPLAELKRAWQAPLAL